MSSHNTSNSQLFEIQADEFIVDLHCHILPGIDDGATDLDMSLEMCRLASASGVSHIVATPHIYPGRFDNDLASIDKAYFELESAIISNNIDISLSVAAEVHICEEIIDWLGRKEIPFLGVWEGAKVLLLELPNNCVPYGTHALIDWLVSNGVRPMIAHPERNRVFYDKPSFLDDLIKRGCLLQVTANAFTGQFGERVRKFSSFLLKQNQITVIASDAHNLNKRSINTLAAKRLISEIVGSQKAMTLMRDNPYSISSILFERCALFTEV